MQFWIRNTLIAGIAVVGFTAATQAAHIDTFDAARYPADNEDVNALNELVASDSSGDSFDATADAMQDGIDTSEVLGGSRDSLLELRTESGEDETGNSTAEIVTQGSGSLEFANSSNEASDLTLTYDFEGDDDGESTENLATASNYQAFVLPVLASDNNADATITVDDGDSSDSVTRQVPDLGESDNPVTLSFDFDSFNGVDLTSAESTSLMIDAQEAGDYNFGRLARVVPAPGALPAGLALLGLAGGGALHRRRRAAK